LELAAGRARSRPPQPERVARPRPATYFLSRPRPGPTMGRRNTRRADPPASQRLRTYLARAAHEPTRCTWPSPKLLARTARTRQRASAAWTLPRAQQLGLARERTIPSASPNDPRAAQPSKALGTPGLPLPGPGGHTRGTDPPTGPATRTGPGAEYHQLARTTLGPPSRARHSALRACHCQGPAGTRAARILPRPK
jgi:hypothetical protein